MRTGRDPFRRRLLETIDVTLVQAQTAALTEPPGSPLPMAVLTKGLVELRQALVGKGKQEEG